MKLKDIVQLQIGYQHRDRSVPIDTRSVGTHRIVQIKDLDLDESFPSLHPGDLYQFTPASDPERYLITEGDILFLSRGARSVAVPIVQLLQNTIASYYFYILRPDTAQVCPEYLAWFINQPTAQIFVERQRRGSHIKIVPKNILAELDVAVPPLSTQRAIVALERLRLREAQQLHQLVALRKRLIGGLSVRAASNTYRETP